MGSVRYTVEDRSGLTYREACKAVHRASGTVSDYAKRHNISIQEALDHYTQQNSERYIVDEVAYEDFEEALAVLGRKYGGYSAWKMAHPEDGTKQGYLDYLVNRRDSSRIAIAGKEYSRARDAVEAAGWTWQAALKYRQHHQCTWEQAINSWVAETSPRSLAQTGDFNGIALAYTGTDGQLYYRCVCRGCSRVLLLPRDIARRYTHNDIECARRECPV